MVLIFIRTVGEHVISDHSELIQHIPLHIHVETNSSPTFIYIGCIGSTCAAGDAEAAHLKVAVTKLKSKENIHVI